MSEASNVVGVDYVLLDAVIKQLGVDIQKMSEKIPELESETKKLSDQGADSIAMINILNDAKKKINVATENVAKFKQYMNNAGATIGGTETRNRNFVYDAYNQA